MRILFLIFLLLQLSCSKHAEEDITVQEIEAVETQIEPDELFPIPELSKDNIKDVNELLMEEMRQSLIDESQKQLSARFEIDELQLDDYVKPELEIDIKKPRFVLDPLNQDAILKVKYEPIYPARPGGRVIDGYVTLEFTVNIDGTVTDIEVIDSSDKYFISPAKKAILKWIYNPKIVNGKPVQSREQVTLNPSIN